MTLRLGLAALAADWTVARLLQRRTTRVTGRIIRRLADGSLWAAGCPQNFGYAMAGLFTPGWPNGSFHFFRVREWRGLLVASPKVFWLAPSAADFVLLYEQTYFVLPRFAEAVECAKIDARRAQRRAAA